MSYAALSAIANLENDELAIAKKLIYEPCGFKCSSIKVEPESSAYKACNFKLDKIFAKHRKAKITPTKVGQFVTLWRLNLSQTVLLRDKL